MKAGRGLDALVVEKVYRCRKCGGSEYSIYGAERRRYCLPCNREARRVWNLNNHEKAKMSRASWAEKHKDQFRQYRKSWALKTRYGLTLEQFVALLKKQGGECAICGAKPNDKPLCVDHSHDTGLVRGLLCDSCNIGLAQFQDNPQLLARAMEYLGFFSALKTLGAEISAEVAG